MISRWSNPLIALAALAALGLLALENAPAAERWAAAFPVAHGALLALFLADVTLRFAAAADKRRYAAGHWYEALVFLPLVHLLTGVPPAPFAALARLAVALMMFVARAGGGGGERAVSAFSRRPAQTLAGGFVLAIFAGAIALSLPAAAQSGERTPFLDALFTATSATCVTGLSVVDLATHFSPFGQIVILALIQLGGLGIMTAAVSLALLLGRGVNVKGQAALQDALDQETLSGARRLTFFIVAMTAAFEVGGAVVLTAAWRSRLGGDWAAAVFHGVFHAVSAFCNAGFSTFSRNLEPFRDDPLTNVAVMILIVGGGIGFLAVQDLTMRARERLARRRPPRLRVQTRVVLAASAILIAGGALAFYGLERQGALAGLPRRVQVWTALFQSVTARTAGFNTCPMAELAPATLFVLMLLMFIGGSPGSAAGGIKTTTLAVLWAVVLSRLRRREQVELCRRTIPTEVALKAATVLCISLAIVLAFTGLLLYTERQPFEEVLFETVSAFATVGLSTGLTPHLTAPGRALVTLLMLIGRLGPLTMAYALAVRTKQPQYTLAEERVMIG